MLDLHDIEAWHAGVAMVHHYGPHALRRPSRELTRCGRSGSVIGAKTWALIADAIIALTRERAHDEPLN